jgi:drug/metabolite transporter (DMT)-like permease
MRASDYRAGLFLVTGSAIAFSLAGLFTRLIHLDIWTMIAWRGIFSAAGIATAILSIERGNSWRRFRTLGLPGWLYAILGAVCMILFVAALGLTTVAHVALIYATVPLFAALLGLLLLRERPSGIAVLASLAA